MAFVSTNKIGKTTYNVDSTIFLETSNDCYNSKSSIHREVNRIHRETSINLKIMHMC